VLLILARLVHTLAVVAVATMVAVALQVIIVAQVKEVAVLLGLAHLQIHYLELEYDLARVKF
jgi:hypothetical protein